MGIWQDDFMNNAILRANFRVEKQAIQKEWDDGAKLGLGIRLLKEADGDLEGAKGQRFASESAVEKQRRERAALKSEDIFTARKAGQPRDGSPKRSNKALKVDPKLLATARKMPKDDDTPALALKAKRAKSKKTKKKTKKSGGLVSY